MLRFLPYYKPVIWGGRRLADLFHRQDLPGDKIGESWELVPFGEHTSKSADGRGEPLNTLWQRGELGGSTQGDFPFLLKWLDTDDRLSLQVHPDDVSAAQIPGAAAKTESWLIAHAEPEAYLLAGHREGLTAEKLEQAVATNDVEKWLYRISPHVGDMILLPGGTLHAIGPGYVILEIQQPSDTTYRVHDWGRVGLDGKPRQLHVEQAQQVIHFDEPGVPPMDSEAISGPCFSMGKMPTASQHSRPEELRVFVAAFGDAVLLTDDGEYALSRGDVVVGQPSDGTITIEFGQCICLSELR